MRGSPESDRERRRFLVVFPAGVLNDEQAAAIEQAIQQAVAAEIGRLGLGIEMGDPRTTVVPEDEGSPWWTEEFKGQTMGAFPVMGSGAIPL